MTDFTDHEGTEDTIRSADNPPTDNRQTPALIEKFVIRLPKGLRNKIKHLSEQNRRSMNSEIIMVLEKHIQQNLLSQSAEHDAGMPISESEHMAKISESVREYKLSDDELSRRLENLPEEKKAALLELLG